MAPLTARSGPRHHQAEAVFNLRDLGGYPTVDGRVTRWGRLFRADGLHRTDEAGAAMVAGLGVRRVIDLRTEHERTADGIFTHPAIENIHIALIDALWKMSDLEQGSPTGQPHAGHADFLLVGYRQMTTEHGARLGQALRCIAEHGHQPLVFHCAAGKDRTGVVAALLLALLGGSDATIAEDFALSAPAAKEMDAWYRQQRGDEMAQRMERLGFGGEKAMRLMSADPATIVTLLGELRSQHGDLERFVALHGVPADTIAALKTHALD